MLPFSSLLATGDFALRQVLGQSVTYRPGTGSAVAVQGVFDSAYVKVDAGTAGVMSTGPAVFLRLSDLPSDPSDDGGAQVTVNAVLYSIREAQPDGLGGVLLLLQTV